MNKRVLEYINAWNCTYRHTARRRMSPALRLKIANHAVQYLVDLYKSDPGWADR